MSEDVPQDEQTSSQTPSLKTLMFFVGATLAATGFLAVLGGMQFDLSYAAENQIHFRDDELTANYMDDGTQYKIKARGTVIFAPDDSGIDAISEGGYVRIQTSERNSEREIEITRLSDGSLERRYWYNGRSHDIDRDAEDWFTETLRVVARTTGLGAESRVDNIHDQYGVDGVLREIRIMDSDSIKGLYFRYLTDKPGIERSEWLRIVEAVGGEIKSDGHKSHVLTSLPATGVDMTDADIQLAMFDSYKTLNSDGHKSHVLETFVVSQDFDTALLFRGVQEINSDGHQAQVMENLLRTADLSDPDLQSLFFTTFRSIQSDGHKANILGIVWDQSGIDKTILLRAVREINSDGHKATLLVRMDRSFNDPALKSLMLDTYRSVNSDGHKAQILESIWQPGFDEAMLLEMVGMINSDGHKANVLMRSVGDLGTPALQAQFVEIMKMINSDGHKAQIIGSLWDQRQYDRATLIEVTEQIRSDGHKSSLLLRMADQALANEQLRPLFLRVTRTIRSDSHLGLIMRKIMDVE